MAVAVQGTLMGKGFQRAMGVHGCVSSHPQEYQQMSRIYKTLVSLVKQLSYSKHTLPLIISSFGKCDIGLMCLPNVL